RGIGLYFHGTAGLFARALLFYLNTCRGMQDDLRQFQLIRDLDEQSEFYGRKIAPKLWSPLVRSVMRQPAVLSLLGVPAEQIDQIKKSSNKKISSFIEDRLEA